MKSNGKMLYLVNLPNGTTFGIQCDPKAIGQKCLEEVGAVFNDICVIRFRAKFI